MGEDTKVSESVYGGESGRQAAGGIPEQVQESRQTAGRDSWQYFKDTFHLHKMDAAAYSPLVLAYIGDAVYEAVIRTLTVAHGNMQVNKMHRHDAGLLKASAQAEMIRLLEPDLTEEEEAVYKRGRNAKSVTSAKNATMIDYRRATGFETLLGYLYLQERFERMTDLIAMGLERIGEKQ